MSSGRHNLERSGGGGGGGPGSGKGRWYSNNQPNRGSRRPQRSSPRQRPTQVNPPPVQPNQRSRRAGGAWGPSSAPATPPVHPPTPPQPGNHLIQVSRPCSKIRRAFCFPILISFRSRFRLGGRFASTSPSAFRREIEPATQI